MKELFTTYSVGDIILFIIALAAAIKGFFTFWDWGYERLKKYFGKKQTEEAFDNTVLTELSKIISQMETIRAGHTEDKAEIVDQIKQVNVQHSLDRQELIKKIEETKETINVLLASDKDDIKSWITEKHHYYCYEKKMIDDYSLDCIEKRYQHYLDEGGNSYVATLMHEIRSLPKVSMLRDTSKKEEHHD